MAGDPAALGDPPPQRRLSDLFAEALGPIDGLRAVDLGCGGGGATRVLARLGAQVLGLDPNAEAVAAARAAGGGPGYRVAGAEATGLDAGSADLVLFSNALHHCADMPAALAEARRILAPAGRLAVLEPVAPDPLWPASRLIDDEAPVYAAAQAALDACGLARISTHRYASKVRIADADEFVAGMRAVDPSRRLDPADRPALEAALAAALRHDADGPYIEHWGRLDVLASISR